jgi:hypothetical protein
MPKCHDDSAMGQASPDINDLLHVKFSSTGTEAVNSPSNIYARGLHIPQKEPPPTAATRQDGIWQKALSPHLAATDRRPVQRAG